MKSQDKLQFQYRNMENRKGDYISGFRMIKAAGKYRFFKLFFIRVGEVFGCFIFFKQFRQIVRIQMQIFCNIPNTDFFM